MRVEDLLETFDGRVFGPVIALLSLLLLTPLGAIPTFPSVVALVILLVALQRALGRTYPWLPEQLSSREVDRARFADGVERARPWIRRVDRFFRPRLVFLVKGGMARVNAVLVVLLACTVVPLELLPGAVAVPALTLLAMGLSIMARDGLLVLLSSAGAIGALYLLLRVVGI